jgi:hypothetical protein
MKVRIFRGISLTPYSHQNILVEQFSENHERWTRKEKKEVKNRKLPSHHRIIDIIFILIKL